MKMCILLLIKIPESVHLFFFIIVYFLENCVRNNTILLTCSYYFIGFLVYVFESSLYMYEDQSRLMCKVSLLHPTVSLKEMCGCSINRWPVW